MRFVPSAIPEVLFIEPQVFGDSRGFFMETWHAAKFAAAGLDLDFVQDNRLYQVCYDLSDPDTLKRETKSLIQAGKKLKTTNLSTH